MSFQVWRVRRNAEADTSPNAKADLSNLAVISYVRKHTMWIYETQHTRREIESLTYFGDMAPVSGVYLLTKMQPGDILWVYHSAPGLERTSLYTIAASGEGIIRLVLMSSAQHAANEDSSRAPS